MKKFNVVRVEKEMLIYNKLLSMLSFEIMVTYVHDGIDVEVIINPRRACAARVTVVGLCVCVSTLNLPPHTLKSQKR